MLTLPVYRRINYFTIIGLWELEAEVGGVYRRWGQAERERERRKEERKYKRGRGKREIREIEKIEKNNEERKIEMMKRKRESER